VMKNVVPHSSLVEFAHEVSIDIGVI